MDFRIIQSGIVDLRLFRMLSFFKAKNREPPVFFNVQSLISGATPKMRKAGFRGRPVVRFVCGAPIHRPRLPDDKHGMVLPGFCFQAYYIEPPWKMQGGMVGLCMHDKLSGFSAV